ncbi:MAG: LysM peptidoglycan-binding domain-containing protein [Acidimicrobiia bacterium]|nr:LysM peptidoglycan-binding domain-containing protein [Acidimicrobiia bacterium]
MAVLVGLVVLMLLVVVAARAALGALGGGPLAAPGTPAGRGGSAAVYVVQPGDTYWSIARRLQPSGDVRALVDRLSTEHAGAPLQPGEQLTLR